ncbi:MAG: 2-oxo acid dehydrogenase subunit E2 [Clostridia bacterium]|nr:2-oxo acid dehydrogenase subunit E2 [Clostridia bacterium]
MEQLPAKKRWGDRRDGYLLRDVDPMHLFVPHLYPNRADSECFVTEQIDLTNLLAYLEKKNADNPEYKYTLFHAIAAALVKTVTLRPKMNRFIQGKRLYQRDHLSLAFVAKKYFGDDAHEALLTMKFDDSTTINSVHDRIMNEVMQVRSGKREDNSTEKMGILVKMPNFLLRWLVNLLHVLDFHGKVPSALIKEDPCYSSVFISNLGSIKLHATYHHLTNWGTNSVFVVIGEKHLAPFFDEQGNVDMRPALELSLTIDERIADGYYYSKTFKLLKHLLQNPQLLELPAKEIVDYE